MSKNQINTLATSRSANMAIFAIIAVLLLAGCSGGDEKAFERAKADDSIEVWGGFVQSYPNSVRVEQAKERMKQLQEIEDLRQSFQGKDAVAKTKVILKMQKTPENALPIEIVPSLISVLTDDTSVQIPENVIGAEVRLNHQFGRGSVLRMHEGDMFPTDSGMVIAGKDAVLRVSTPGDEARAVLVKLAGKDFGADVAKWQEWWIAHRQR